MNISAEDEYAHKEYVYHILALMRETLTTREYQVVIAYCAYSFLFRQIAAAHTISLERTRQILRRALNKLRGNKEIRDYENCKR